MNTMRFAAVMTAALVCLIAGTLLVSGCWGKKLEPYKSSVEPPITPAPLHFATVLKSVSGETVDPKGKTPVTITFTAAGTPTASVQDSSGKVVRDKLTISSASGSDAQTGTTVTWDGKDNDGVPVADGDYKVIVETKDAEPLNVPVTVKAGAAPSITIPDGSVPSRTYDPTSDSLFTFTVTAPEGSTVKAIVRNSADNAVRTLKPKAGAKAGEYKVSWDGKTDSGDVAKDGAYTIALDGKTSDGTALSPSSVSVTVKTSGPNPPVPPVPPTPAVASDKTATIIWQAADTTVNGVDLGFYIATRKQVAGMDPGEGAIKVLAVPRVDPGVKIVPDQVTYKVNIPRDGTYYLWARTIWSTGCGNTFYINVEGYGSGQWILGGDATYDILHWVCLSDGGDNSDNPRPLTLKQGPVTFTLGTRESATQVHLFLLTTDAKKIPAGSYTPTPNALIK